LSFGGSIIIGGIRWIFKILENYGFCVIQKLFPYDRNIVSMKLTRGKLIETIRKKNQGWTTYQARKIAGISIRRVNQVYRQYLISGEISEIMKIR